jgi:hypothetical protein
MMTAISSPPTTETQASAAWLRRFARTTPGVVGLLAVTIAGLCVIAGVVCAAQLNTRVATHRAVLDRSEPFAYAAQNLYASLSAADAAAASAFLSGGNQTPAMRAQYQQALADASAALADAGAGATTADRRTAVAEITTQLTAYTGLVEAARADNLQVFPIGSAYLGEASTLMQTKLLPEAEKIYTSDLAAVRDGQGVVGSSPTAGLALLALVVVVIMIGSVIVYLRTNRQFNVGLVVAATLVALTAGWIVVATHVSTDEVEHSRAEGTALFEQLTQARILAAKARTEETLELIAHGDISVTEASFTTHLNELRAVLPAGPSAAADSIRNWDASHQKQVQAYGRGDYQGAVAQAIGTDPAASAAQFAAVESSLHNQIEQSRTALRDGVSSAGVALSWTPPGTVLLMVFAAAAASAGLWPRLKEFL